MDNILGAHELIHFLNIKRNRKNELMSLKLDMRKAYNSVRWDSLENVMMKMGLERKLVNLIIFCVRSVSFSKLVNGELQGNIIPSTTVYDKVTSYHHCSFCFLSKA